MLALSVGISRALQTRAFPRVSLALRHGFQPRPIMSWMYVGMGNAARATAWVPAPLGDVVVWRTVVGVGVTVVYLHSQCRPVIPCPL
jgi:fermentation-respiration switch protein FrsA (DUF1100 family)